MHLRELLASRTGSLTALSTTTTATTDGRWGLNRETAALVSDVAFLLIGVLGPIVGGGPRGEPVVFGRDYLHDAVHLGSGLLADALYDDGEYARECPIEFGAVYLLLVAGVVVPGPMNDLLAIDTTDNALHLVLTVGLLDAGFGLDDRDRPRRRSTDR